MSTRFLMAALAIVLATPACARWRVAETEHFELYGQADPADIRSVATRLERYDSAMRFLFRLNDDPPTQATRVTVYITRDLNGLQRLYSQNSITRNTIVYGYYHSSVEGSTAFAPTIPAATDPLQPDGLTALLHEYAHHVMLSNFSAAYPAWFQEGFAEFCSNSHFEADGSVTVGHAAIVRAFGLEHGWRLRASELFGPMPAMMRSDEIESLYGRGWLLTHYLVLGSKPRARQLGQYLTAINAGTPSLTAAKQVFGDLSALDRELDAYMAVPLDNVRVPADRLKVGEIKVRELSDGEDAILPVRMRSRSGVSRSAAADVVRDARRIAQSFPDDATVQLALAEAEFDAGNDMEADAAAARSFKVAPSARALLYRARAALRRGRKDAAHPDPALLAEGRRYILDASRLDGGDPLPLFVFYQNALASGTVNGNAKDALERAFELVPQAQEVRMAVARQRADDGDINATRFLLTPLALDPHAERSYAAAVLRLIDDGKGDDARALLDHPETFKAGS